MTMVSGRTAFITGGANVIRLGIAQAFMRAGVKLALVDIDEAALKAAGTHGSALGRVRIAEGACFEAEAK